MVEHCLRLVWRIKTFFIWTSTFLPKQRDKIRYWLFAFVMFLFVVNITKCHQRILFFGMNGVKYNFIAVNYLVYTNEVIGNIMESYPVVPLFSGLL
jgi:hypothetical protein